MRRPAIIILSIAVALVLFLVLCTFRVRPYETAILNRFGKAVPESDQVTLAYGWRLCWPTDNVIRLDKRLHLLPSQLTQVAAKNGETISVQSFAAWRISDPAAFYNTFRGSDATAQQVIGTRISGQLLAVLAAHQLDELFNVDPSKIKTDDIEKEIVSRINEHSSDAGTSVVMEGLRGQGVEVVQIGFSRFTFSPTVVDAVYKRMASERAYQAGVFQSSGIARAAELRAEGNHMASDLRAQAESEATKIRGQGDAEALRILQEATKDPDALNFYRFWREIEIFRNSIGNGTILIIRADEPVQNMFSHIASSTPTATTRPAKQGP